MLQGQEYHLGRLKGGGTLDVSVWCSRISTFFNHIFFAVAVLSRRLFRNNLGSLQVFLRPVYIEATFSPYPSTSNLYRLLS